MKKYLTKIIDLRIEISNTDETFKITEWEYNSNGKYVEYTIDVRNGQKKGWKLRRFGEKERKKERKKWARQSESFHICAFPVWGDFYHAQTNILTTKIDKHIEFQISTSTLDWSLFVCSLN